MPVPIPSDLIPSDLVPRHRISGHGLSLALVVWHGLPAALPAAGHKVGGLETGAWELARGLATAGHCRVKFVVESPRSTVPPNVAAVELVPVLNRWRELREDFAQSVDLSGSPRLKRWSWRLLYQFPLLLVSRPWRTPDPLPLAPDPRLAKVLCDVWVCFGVNQDSARVIATACAQRRPCLLFLESNADLLPVTDRAQAANEYGVTAVERAYCLGQATEVVCQSYWQARRLQEDQGRVGCVIRNPIHRQVWERQQPPTTAGYVLWIGRYDDFHKRPLLALELARRCPQLPFRMIINRSSREIESQVRRDLPANVELINYVPYDQMPGMFRQARCFLSTSAASHEGFPNVILQAAAAGVPIVSLEDFDNFIATAGVGYCAAGDLERAAQQLQYAWSTGQAPDPAQALASLQPFEQQEVARQVAELALQVHERFTRA